MFAKGDLPLEDKVSARFVHCQRRFESYEEFNQTTKSPNSNDVDLSHQMETSNQENTMWFNLQKLSHVLNNVSKQSYPNNHLYLREVKITVPTGLVFPCNQMIAGNGGGPEYPETH